ncbi:hypothetical protein BU15DRAFT_69585 [Melanogaster broomeanus]|nr:hypothetical protein BU15DRAFT_69585 [Melanogaster broomeanus]
MPHLHKLHIFQEEWNPSFIKTSFDWPALDSANVADDGSIEYLGRSPGTGWGVSFTLSRVAEPPPTKSKKKKGPASISVWELAASHFHPEVPKIRLLESDLTDAMGSFFIRDPEDQSSGPPLILEDYEYESDSDLDDDEIFLGRSQTPAPALGEVPSASQPER